MALNHGKFCCIVVVILTMILVVHSKVPKIVKCHVCSNQEDLECDFIHTRETKFLTACNDVINEMNITVKAKCIVERDFSTHFPTVNRKCGPADCGEGMECCECTKSGCNGNNKCQMVFNACNLARLSKFLLFAFSLVYYIFV